MLFSNPRRSSLCNPIKEGPEFSSEDISEIYLPTLLLVQLSKWQHLILITNNKAFIRAYLFSRALLCIMYDFFWFVALQAYEKH